MIRIDVEDQPDNKNAAERRCVITYEDGEDLRRLHHDFQAAIRSFGHLSRMVDRTLDSSQDTDRRKAAVLRRNLENLQRIKSDLIDRIFPLDGDQEPP